MFIKPCIFYSALDNNKFVLWPTMFTMIVWISHALGNIFDSLFDIYQELFIPLCWRIELENIVDWGACTSKTWRMETTTNGSKRQRFKKAITNNIKRRLTCTNNGQNKKQFNKQQLPYMYTNATQFVMRSHFVQALVACQSGHQANKNTNNQNCWPCVATRHNIFANSENAFNYFYLANALVFPHLNIPSIPFSFVSIERSFEHFLDYNTHWQDMLGFLRCLVCLCPQTQSYHEY